MKYFTWDFMFGSEQKNEIEQKEHNEEFRLLQEKNLQNFSNVKNVFSKESLYNYEESGRFHDYEITNLNIFANRKSKIYPRMEVTVKLSGEREYVINYKGVRFFNIVNEMDNDYSRAISKWYEVDEFLYDEFDVSEKGFYTHDVLLATGSTLKIEFKKIIIKKMK